jgi:hypothetical protein
MKLNIVCVKDRAVNAFGRPMFVPAVGSAIRSFTDEINRENIDNHMYNHSDDFDLYDVGMFDDADCQFILHEKPILVLSGKQAKILSST